MADDSEARHAVWDRIGTLIEHQDECERQCECHTADEFDECNAPHASIDAALDAYGEAARRAERASMPCYRGSCEQYRAEKFAIDGPVTVGLCESCQARAETAAEEAP